jgi:nucleoside-diphosphate-sugar epimerase
MPDPLPRLILTGASGIVGRGFLQAAQDRFEIYAIARRPQQKASVPLHPNIHWLQVDIGHRDALHTVMSHIEERGGADYVLHLAAHYDFENIELEEYQHTNINGTRYMLEESKRLGISHFIFASSVAACEFPTSGQVITESTPPDADYPYARSKKVGEEMMREYADFFDCSTVRLAAVFSDWCEYAPLYVFLSTWLSRRWNARILGGRGASAIPYIHIRDLSRLFFTLLEKTGDLPSPGTYIASPDGAISQRQLFDLATRFQFRRSVRPVLMPKPLAWVGILGRDLLGRMLRKRPFERLWMIEYLDRSLTIDGSHTRQVLGWGPSPRHHILRRLLFLIEKMKTSPQEWVLRNERAMKRPLVRPSLVIHESMVEAREAIVDAIVAYLQSPVRHDRFPDYAALSWKELRWYIGVIYDLLTAAVRTGDRELLLHYIHDLARRRFAGGFPPAEVCDALLVINDITVEELLFKAAVADYRDEVRDSITLSVALAIDGVQDAYDILLEASPAVSQELGTLEENGHDLETIVEKLNAFYRPTEREPAVPKGLSAAASGSSEKI